MRRLVVKWGHKFSKASITPVTGIVWHVQVGEELFILKRRTDRTTVWAEYDLMSWLREQGQPVSVLLFTEQDAPWAEYEGGIYVLYPYVDGTSGDNLSICDENYAYEIGVNLARLHQCLQSYPHTSEFPTFDIFSEVSCWAWPAVKGYLGGRFQTRLHDLETQISRNFVMPYEVLPRQLIHRDMHPGNMVFREGKLAAFLDFDRVRTGVRIFDLCYCSTAVLSTIFTDQTTRQLWPKFVQDLIKSYVMVEPLTQAEGLAFLYMCYLIQFLFIWYQLDFGNNQLADLNGAMLLWIHDQHSVLEPLIQRSISL